MAVYLVYFGFLGLGFCEGFFGGLRRMRSEMRVSIFVDGFGKRKCLNTSWEAQSSLEAWKYSRGLVWKEEECKDTCV